LFAGNERLFDVNLTSAGDAYYLRIDLEASVGERRERRDSVYNNFHVGSENEKYRMSYTGHNQGNIG